MLKSIFLIIFPFLVAGDIHPLHVSVTEINFDDKDKALEIVMRVFIDDLETTMKSRLNAPELDILNPKTQTLDQMLEKYLNERFTIQLDRKKQLLHYLGHEKDGEAFVFYVEVQKIKKLKDILISNSILTETFEDQSNLVHVTSRGTVQSLRLNKSNPSGNLTFEE